MKYSINKNGFYGNFGGAFVPEMPYPNLEELEKNYNKIINEEDFIIEYNSLLKDYVGRPTPLYFAERMSVTYPMASDLSGDLFSLFAGPKQGVTRNILLNDKGEIIFLTRLYERDEFEEMISVIKHELKK